MVQFVIGRDLFVHAFWILSFDSALHPLGLGDRRARRRQRKEGPSAGSAHQPEDIGTYISGASLFFRSFRYCSPIIRRTQVSYVGLQQRWPPPHHGDVWVAANCGNTLQATALFVSNRGKWQWIAPMYIHKEPRNRKKRMHRFGTTTKHGMDSRIGPESAHKVALTLPNEARSRKVRRHLGTVPKEHRWLPFRLFQILEKGHPCLRLQCHGLAMLA